MVTVHIHRDFKIYHNHLIFLILRDHAKVRRAKVLRVFSYFKKTYRRCLRFWLFLGNGIYSYQVILLVIILMKATSSKKQKKATPDRKPAGKVKISATASGLTSQAGLISNRSEVF